MSNHRTAISCPECHVRYAIPAGSIDAEGRQVRCASCQHAWIAYPSDEFRAVRSETRADAGMPAEEPASEPGPDSAAKTAYAEWTDVEPVMTDATDMVVYQDEPEAVETKPRRNRMKMLTGASALVALVATGVGGWTLYAPATPKIAPGPALSIEIPDGPVRRTSDAGTETIVTTARVTNEGDSPRSVPELHARMRDTSGRVIHEWKVPPPARRIAPHSAIPIRVQSTGEKVPEGPLTLDIDIPQKQQ